MSLCVESTAWSMALVGAFAEAETTTKPFMPILVDGSNMLERREQLDHADVLQPFFFWISNNMVGGAGQTCGNSFMRATPKIDRTVWKLGNA